MSFFDNPKNAGLALMVLAVIELVAAAVAIYDAVQPKLDTNILLVAIAALICAVLYFLFARRVREGMSKIDILANFVIVNGLCMAIPAVVSLVISLEVGIVGIILGVIVVLIGKRINDNTTDTLDKIIWIVLVLIFIISVLGSFVALFGVFNGTMLEILLNVVTAVSSFMVAVFMLLLLLDSEVRKQMGM